MKAKLQQLLKLGSVMGPRGRGKGRASGWGLRSLVTLRGGGGGEGTPVYMQHQLMCIHATPKTNKQSSSERSEEGEICRKVEGGSGGCLREVWYKVWQTWCGKGWLLGVEGGSQEA